MTITDFIFSIGIPLLGAFAVLGGVLQMVVLVKRNRLALLASREPKVSKSPIETDQSSSPEVQYSSPVNFVDVKIDRKGINDPESLASYFKFLKDYISLAKKSILVMDYLPSYDGIKALANSSDEKIRADGKKLGSGYKEYFQLILARMNDGVEYRRILQVPFFTPLLGMDKDHEVMMLNNFGSQFEPGELSGNHPGVELAASLASRKLIEHINEAWQKHSDKFNLYVLPKPVVNYSYIVIDDSYVISIYTRNESNGIAFIDELYVNTSDSVPNQVQKRHDQFLEVVKNLHPIGKDVFQHAINDFANRSKETYEDAKKKKEQFAAI